MASKQVSTSHRPRCVVCNSVVRNSSINCHHSFCEICIFDYYETRSETNSSNASSCPVCSQTRESSDKEKKEQLVPNVQGNLQPTESLAVDVERDEETTQKYPKQPENVDRTGKSKRETVIYDRYQRNKEREQGYQRENVKLSLPADEGLLEDFEQLPTSFQSLEIDKSASALPGLHFDAPLQNTINIHVKERDALTDVALLEVDGVQPMVVCCSDTWLVKSLFVKEGKRYESRLKMPDYPGRLAKLSPDMVVITVPEKKQIILAQVCPDLKQILVINTNKSYCGITCLYSSMFAACQPLLQRVDILDISGTLIRSLTPKLSQEYSLKLTSCLATTKDGNILVNDYGKSIVICMSLNGDVIFTFSPGEEILRSPIGVTVTNTGDILIADNVLNRILQLTESGKFVRNVLTLENGVMFPQGICIDDNGKLYVSLRTANMVKVFENVK